MNDSQRKMNGWHMELRGMGADLFNPFVRRFVGTRSMLSFARVDSNFLKARSKFEF